MALEIEPSSGEEWRRRLLVASTYLDDVLSNRHVEFIPTESHVKIYQNFKKTIFVFLAYLSFILILCLSIFEEPSVPNWGIPYWATLIIKFLCLSFFIFR